jgi:tetratricopeptide (TPR) repeat protein
VIEINPNNTEIYSNLGLVYYNQGKYPQAISEFEKVIRLDPNNAMAYYNLGLVYKEQGKITESEAEFKKAKDMVTE